MSFFKGDGHLNKLVLKYIGVDDWSRPTYETESGEILKDVNCGDSPIELTTVCGGFDGEPDTPIEKISRFKDVEITIVGDEHLPSEDEKRRCMMLSRLQSDCEYYLGFGNRSDRHLYHTTPHEHIEEMKKLYDSFSESQKPEWITLEDIKNYEAQMLQTSM